MNGQNFTEAHIRIDPNPSAISSHSVSSPTQLAHLRLHISHISQRLCSHQPYRILLAGARVRQGRARLRRGGSLWCLKTRRWRGSRWRRYDGDVQAALQHDGRRRSRPLRLQWRRPEARGPRRRLWCGPVRGYA